MLHKQEVLQLRQGEDPVVALLEMVTKFVFSVLGMSMHGHIFKKEMGWEGLAGQRIGPVKALVIGVIVLCLPS